MEKNSSLMRNLATGQHICEEQERLTKPSCVVLNCETFGLEPENGFMVN